MLYCRVIKDFSAKLPKTGSLLGIDYGAKKLGLSISDEMRVMAMPYKIIRSSNFQEIGSELKKIIMNKAVSGVVIGYPLESSGNVGESCERVERFVRSLELLGLEVPYYYQDERLSTKSATKFLRTQFSSNKRLEQQDDDSLAASYILQTTLDLINNSQAH